jgi:hypothetical protein
MDSLIQSLNDVALENDLNIILHCYQIESPILNINNLYFKKNNSRLYNQLIIIINKRGLSPILCELMPYIDDYLAL